jgi:BolA protein
MLRRDRIISALKDHFTPDYLEVRDVSAQHHGHVGWREGGETHFEIEIRATALSELSRINAHRTVNEALSGEFADGLHALQINILR